jgi:hypothetical protein
MAARHILYLTNEKLVCLVARGARIAQREEFPVTGAGHTDFESYLKGLRKLPVHLITDLAEEDFRLDTIPHLRGGDRDAVMARKLGQIFRNTPYKHAFPQGREPEGRKDDRVLYTAITNGEVLRPWVEVLERLKVPVEGIYSSAVFSGRLLGDMGLAHAHALLVTFTPGDTVRQTYFRDKEIKFSRLTPLLFEEGQSLGSLLAAETARTWQYLDSLRYFAPTDKLEVVVLVHPKDRAAVEPFLRDFDQIEYRLLDIEEVAAKLGLKPPPVSSNAEEILTFLFLRRKTDNHYASPELRRYATLRNVNGAIFTAAGAVLAAGLAYGGWNLWFGLQERERNLQTTQRIQAAGREFEEINAALPKQGLGGPAMRETVAFYTNSLRAYPTVASFLVPISGVLDRYPKIRLTQVVWQAADDDKFTPKVNPVAIRATPPIKTSSTAPDPKQGNAPPPQPQGPQGLAAGGVFSSGRHAVALLEGTVKVDGIAFREALAQVEALTADLNKMPGYRASVIESPFQINALSTIQGRLLDRDAEPSEARFTLKVTRPTEPRT